MSRLLTAKGVVSNKHFLKNVSVSNLGSYELNIVCLAEFRESKVSHYCSDDCVFVELSACLEIKSAHSHYHISIDKSSVFVNAKTSVSVSVKSNSAVKLV